MSALFAVFAAGVEVPCELVQVAAHPAALGKQSGNGSQGFFSAVGNDNSALNLCTVQRTADESGQGEMKELCGIFEFQFFSFRHKVWGNLVIAPTVLRTANLHKCRFYPMRIF